ncbi:response regulator transcription factor [Priestia taiwanensis]|uniref:DNA-binding response regulator n=1 Tax=Priestia taiwanensis TaxID=1347902 RepID=A0A917ENK9_9BACI|nr:response regulator transcription factor [Priestia taiwanensis]MBM7363066.1 DNA-binding response OmpR family regulator [Priestia taiwanensis]GGE67396.1 DNA-binding response regulator [Priestia taiwanensis]
MNVLIADDEVYMLKILQAYFEKAGFRTFLAKDGEEALAIFYEETVDLAILDWMMPYKSGMEVCKEIKRSRDVKVLILTAKGEHEDECHALEAGADEYVRKPFDPQVLLLRAKKLIQRTDCVYIRNMRIDFTGKKVWLHDMDVQITNKEFQLLKILYEHKGQILTRDTLLDRIWGFDYEGDERTVDTHIKRLREKIGAHWIKTHRNMGYSFEENHE